MLIIEFSECFPTKYKPVTGEFVYQHAKSLARGCKVICFVPLRFVPTRELFSGNLLTTLRHFVKWLGALLQTKNYSEEQLEVKYLPYVSLIRPKFSFLELSLFERIFFARIRRHLKNKKPSIIYCHFFLPGIKLCIRLAQYYKVPLALDHHEPLDSIRITHPKHYRAILKNVEYADLVIVHSEFNKNKLIDEAERLTIKLPQIRKIYLGQPFDIQDFHRSTSNKIVLITVAHLVDRVKNIDILIKGFARLKKCNHLYLSLQIVGDGRLRKYYESVAKEFKVNDRVEFLGQKSRHEVRDLMRNADIFVLPSYPESFGLVFIEALANGLPVITCKGNGGGEELKQLGDCVKLVEPFSESDLADGILDLVQNEKKRREMSEIGRKIVAQYFTWEKHGEVIFSSIRELVSAQHHVKKTR